MIGSSFSPEAISDVAIMLNFAELDWGKQFKTGVGPGPEKKENYGNEEIEAKGLTGMKIGKGPGNQGKNKEVGTEMLSGPALEKGPANPQGGSSKEVFGLRALG